MFPYTFAVCITTNLIFYDIIPVSSKETHSYNLIFTLHLVNVMNCCSWLSNVLIWGPSMMVSYYFQLKAKVDVWIDPYTGETLSED